MIKFKVGILFGVFCILVFAAYKPSGNLDELSAKIISLLTTYKDETPEEKVFLHLDKDQYAAGEDIWFSIYLTAGSPDIPSPLSKVVYVDMLDNKGNLIEQKTIKILDGHGYGDFKLSYFFPEGIYHLKAYSTWMRGFGEDHAFTREIEIFEPLNMNFQAEVTFDMILGEGDEIKYAGNIKALNKDLKPLKAKKINYQLFTSQHLLGEGDLTLNNEGTVSLEVFLNKADLNTTVLLKLIYEENDDFQITRSFKMPFPESVIDLQFMPEGGEVIEGILNKVAFRAVYPDGTPAKVKGELRGPNGFLKSFETNNNGLGYFTFVPHGTDYSAFLETQNESLSLDFPEIKSSGLNLSIDTQNEGLINMLIQAKDYASLDADLEGLLVVHARGMIGYIQKLNMAGGVAGARINTSQLAPGINQVTVFNGSGQPLAERLVFVDFTDSPKIEVLAEKKDFQKKGKNVIKLKLDADKFEGGNYSVSITDASGPVTNSSTNILTYLKFSSELKGKVSDHELYVDGKLDHAAIDLIMLTNGWRRFDWNKVFEKGYKNESHIEQGINVMGTVSPKHKSKKGLQGGKINVILQGAYEEYIVADFSVNGRFILDALDFQDTSTMVLSAEDGRQKNMLKISVDQPLSKSLEWKRFEPLLRSQIIHPEMRNYLETIQEKRLANLISAGEDEIILEEFIVRSNREVDKEDGITRIYGKGDDVLRVVDFPNTHYYYTVADLINGRMTGVTVKPNVRDPMKKIIILRGQGKYPPPIPPLFFIDNLEVDFKQFTTINPVDVLTVEVFLPFQNNVQFGSPRGGVIAIYTKRGGGFYKSDGVLHTKYPGYSTSREYYVPKYEEEEKRGQADYRNTLYWNPLLRWKGKETEIEFYNNDVSEKFKVVVQGMDKLGRLTYAEKIIE